jgi:hypothetical protein
MAGSAYSFSRQERWRRGEQAAVAADDVWIIDASSRECNSQEGGSLDMQRAIAQTRAMNFSTHLSSRATTRFRLVQGWRSSLGRPN